MSCRELGALQRHPDGFLEIEPTGIPGDRRVRIIDVREPHEFTGELGHIPGAELVPLATVTAAAAEWTRDEPLVVVCRSGGRSARAVRALRDMGFGCAVNLRGGMLSYRAAAGA